MTLLFGTIDDLLHTGEITKKELQFLKLTIQSFLLSIPFLKHPPGRPIVAGIGSLTALMSTFVDHFIRPIAEATSSFIMDTGHFLTVTEAVNPLREDEIILVSLDVSALYTSIHHKGGLEALEYCVITHTHLQIAYLNW